MGRIISRVYDLLMETESLTEFEEELQLYIRIPSLH